MAETRDKAIYVADVATQLGRYNDFKKFIRAACTINANLSVIERDILWKGYECAIWYHREELDLLSSQLKQQGLNAVQLDVITKYQTKVGDEIIETCYDFIDLIDHSLLPAARDDAESIVFYQRMKGQQYYHMARIKAGRERQHFAERSRIAYEVAVQTANTRLSPANVERLRLANYRCVLYNEIFNEKQRARACAIAAVRSAIIDGQPEESFQSNSFTALLDLMKFIEGIDNEIREDEMRAIPIIGNGQEGGDEPQRRGSA